MDNSGYIPTVISLCSGYGGIERGLDLAGIEHRVLAYVEIEAFAIANLVKKMEDGLLPPAPVYTDLKTFPAGLFRDAVDLITGGYPCQPFSAAGKRLGSEDPRHLWPFISEAVRVIRPSRVFFENVEGHISLGLNDVISDLEDRGYGTTWGIFSAAEVGAPHQRKRVYIMGDAQHDGPHGSAFGGGTAQTGDHHPQGQDEAGEPPGTGEPRRGGSVRGELADTECQQRNQGHQDTGGCGEGSGAGQERLPVSSSNGEELADTLDTGLEGHTGHGNRSGGQVGQETQPDGPVGEGGVCEPGHSLADTRGAGQQVPLQQSGNGRGAGGNRQTGGAGNSGAPEVGACQSWEPEPNVGRVVDGCPDRVDRIRLLGNGVVPQTAAKAWSVLLIELEYGE